MVRRKRDGLFIRGRLWWARTDPITGKQQSTGQTDRKLAARWLAERKRLAEDPHYAISATASLGLWVAKTLQSKATDKSPSTLIVYRQKLGHFLRIWGEHLPLFDIVPTLCDAYTDQRRSEGVTDHTIVKEFSALSQLLKLARRSGCYPHQIEALRPLDVAPRYRPRERNLTPEELGGLLRASAPRLRSLVAVTVSTGARLSEALKLSRGDVGSDWVAHLEGTKTEESDRVIPVLGPFRELLASAFPYIPLESYRNVTRDLAAACKRAGIERVTPNDLRRTHATLLISAGVDREVVRRLLGHKTSAMVERVYGRPTPEALAQLASPALETLRLPVPDATIVATVKRLGTGKDPKTCTGQLSSVVEQRFRKPLRILPDTPSKAEIAADLECHGEHSVVGQGHSSATEDATASAWSLAYAYASLLVGRAA